MENPNILKLKIPKLNLNPKKQVVIFGTGEVAECYLQQIVKEYGIDKIAFFLDSRNQNTHFHNKSIVHPEQLKKDPEKNNRIYLPATFSATVRMKNILMGVGIQPENILEPMKSCSVEAMLSEINSLSSVLIYPPICQQKQLEEMINRVHYYVPEKVESDCTFAIDTPLSAVSNIRAKLVNSEETKLNYTLYDLILVWDSDRLFDDEILHLDHVYCIDNQLITNLDVKIFSGINQLLEKEKQHYYENMSRQNWLDLEQAIETSESYIFGSGPSVSTWIENLGDNTLKGLKIVCNHFHNSKKLMERINPELYVLYDFYYFVYEQKEILDHIIETIQNTKCKLIVPDIFVGMLYCRYNLDITKLIGLKIQDRSVMEFQFPNADDMCVRFANNVITAFSIPIAASLSQVINIIGCDGRKNPDKKIKDEVNSDKRIYWNYDNELLGMETIYIENISDEILHYKEHLDTMESLIAFGEERKKEFYTRTYSYIPALNKRWKQ